MVKKMNLKNLSLEKKIKCSKCNKILFSLILNECEHYEWVFYDNKEELDFLEENMKMCIRVGNGLLVLYER